MVKSFTAVKPRSQAHAMNKDRFLLSGRGVRMGSVFGQPLENPRTGISRPYLTTITFRAVSADSYLSFYHRQLRLENA